MVYRETFSIERRRRMPGAVPIGPQPLPAQGAANLDADPRPEPTPLERRLLALDEFIGEILRSAHDRIEKGGQG